MTDATTSSAEATSHIRAAILAGDFIARQRLVEADLSEQFGASRSAVRTALLTLEAEGLVERLPNRGARVRGITRDEAIEIVEVRIGLEGLCARKAATNASDNERAELRALAQHMNERVAVGDLAEYAELNQRFDARVREISGHTTAATLLERLRAQSARHQFRLAFVAGRAQRSVKEHEAIATAIAEGNAEAADAATRTHLEGIIALLREPA